jgi:cytochrome P450
MADKRLDIRYAVEDHENERMETYDLKRCLHMIDDRLPPGPKQNLFPVLRMAAFSRKPLAFLEQMAHSHGDISYIQLAGGRFYLINHPEYIQAVLYNHQNSFSKDQFSTWGNGLIQNTLPDFEPASQQLLSLSRFLEGQFRGRELEKTALQITRQFALDWQTGRKIEISFELKRLVTQILSQLRNQAGPSDVWPGGSLETPQNCDILVSALTWTCAVIAQNIDIEKQLVSEITQANLGQDELSTTRRVFNETMRLNPPVWMTQRQVVSDFVLGGYPLPQGANVLLSAWVIQRDARFYPVPLLFDPDRWPSQPGESSSKYTYFPFGCLEQPGDQGRYHSLVTRLVVTILGALLKDWRFHLLSKAEMQPKTSSVLLPKQAVYMRLEQR